MIFPSHHFLPTHRFIVILQAMKEDIPLETKSRDKFLVQSIPISMDSDTASVADLVRRLISERLVDFD